MSCYGDNWKIKSISDNYIYNIHLMLHVTHNNVVIYSSVKYILSNTRNILQWPLKHTHTHTHNIDIYEYIRHFNEFR